MSFQTILTTLGEAAIATALANESYVNIHEIAIGDGAGTHPTPDQAQTQLVREVYRAQINLLTTDVNNPNWIIAELIVPSNVGGWAVREVGVYDNSGTMIAVGNFPETYKPLIEEGSSRELIIRVSMEVSDTAAITLQIDPSVVLASRQWVADNFSIAFLLPGGTTGHILRKKSNQSGDIEWYDPSDPINTVVDVIEENQVLADSQTIVVLAVATTDSTSYYVDGVRLRNSEYTVDSATQITLAVTYPANTILTAVQNEPTGAVEYLSAGRDLQEIADRGPEAQARAREALGVEELSAIQRAVLEQDYPIGEIKVTRRSGAPNTWEGAWEDFGELERAAKGQVLVGYDAEDSNFNALGKTGGSKTHRLTEAEMPNHGHKVNPPNANTSASGSHSHNVNVYNRNGSTRRIANFGDTGSLENSGDLGSTQSAGNHSHAVNIPEFDSGKTGGNQAHNNLQPYVVVHYWIRTA